MLEIKKSTIPDCNHERIIQFEFVASVKLTALFHLFSNIFSVGYI